MDGQFINSVAEKKCLQCDKKYIKKFLLQRDQKYITNIQYTELEREKTIGTFKTWLSFRQKYP